ncbi:response regulator transcription factor [bacterium SCSIO 12643]|nr:response regulator transcription factor [bacterium SCSIO 12643]
MNAIIIEDEPRAAKRLQSLLNEIDPSIQVLAQIESISEAKEFLESHQHLDLIFSDIQLADGLSFEIYDNLVHLPPIIFTTAYDQYAIKAFKNNGIDYLLKPINPEELQNAIGKLNRFQQKSIDPNILQLLAQQIHQPDTQSYKDRFLVKVGQHLKSFSTQNIHAFYSLEKATFIQTHDGRHYVIDHTIDHLESILNPKLFFRLNRKYILNINASFEITAWTNSRLKITLEGSDDDMIIVARNRTKEFKHWLGESSN